MTRLCFCPRRLSEFAELHGLRSYPPCRRVAEFIRFSSRDRFPMSRASRTDERAISKSLREYLRGIAGGLLFSLPLLYTMEVWWAGFIHQPERLILYIGVTFCLLLGYNRFAGMRRDANWLEVMIDSVEEMGLGLIIAAVVLFFLGRITHEMTIPEVVGKIVMEAMTVAIGVSVGTAQLGGGDARDKQDKGTGEQISGFASQLVVALCGGVLFAANVAPTEEIPMIALETASWRLIGLAVLSLCMAAAILFYSEFSGAERFVHGGTKTRVITGTVIAYGCALFTAAMILWFFGRFDDEPLITCVGQTVVLGVAAALGTSAGRLLLQ
jgi:putative integral membrane protein (TIGR02587 family)